MTFSFIKITSTWVALLLFTMLAIIASFLGLEHEHLLIVVAFITITKGMLVMDVFMGFREAPKFWYRFMASYVCLVPTIIFLIYFSAQ
jgi:general stress protein CsbA